MGSPESFAGRSVLRERDFALLAGSTGLSAMGDWLALVPLALLIESMTDSGLAVAGLFIAFWGPQIALAGLAGHLVDNYETTKVLRRVAIAQAVVAIALAFANPVWLILSLSALLGAGLAISGPAEFTLVPAVAGLERIQAANGYMETVRYAGFTVGPLVGGLLAAGGGTEIALLANAATFAAVAVATVAMRTRREPLVAADDADGSEKARHARQGFAVLFGERALALVMTIALISLVFMTASAAAEVFFATDDLGVGESGYGALITSWTLGMAIGSLFVARLIPVSALIGGSLVAIVIQGAGLGFPTLWLVFPLALGGYAVGGLAHGTKNVLVRTLIHSRVPERLHGRAFAAYNAFRNGAEVIALAGGGVLVAVIGSRTTLSIAGFVPVIAAVVGLIVLSGRLRRELKAEPEPEPDPALA